MITLEQLTEIFYKHDPAYLVNMGVPKDEYESEAKRVLLALGNCKNAEDAGDLIYDVFDYMFGVEDVHYGFKREVFDAVGNEVWELINE